MKSKVLRNILDVDGAGIIGVYLVVLAGLSITCPNFLKFSNIMTRIRQVAYTATVAFVVIFAISLGGTDLFIGSTVGVSGMILVATILGGYNIYLTIDVVVLLGAFIDLTNGPPMTRLRTTYFIAAPGIMSILGGLIHVYAKGIPFYGLKYPEIQFVSQGYIEVIPLPITFTLIILSVCYYLFYKTKFGRYTISIGDNEDTVKLTEISVDKIKILVLMLSGVLCTIVGMVLASRSEATVPKAGNAYEMDAIIATVIGETSMLGGKGNMVGIAFGATLVATTKNGLGLLNVNALWHQVVIGIFILFTMALDGCASTRAARNG